MKYLSSFFLILSFIYFPESFGNDHSQVNIKVHTQEITIDDHRLSSEIFKTINISAKRFDQIAGVYKLGKYTYCRTVLSQMKCYLYLSLDLDGSLSSPWVDPDFGKGDAIDYITSPENKSKASFILEKNHLFIWFHGKGAKKIYDKIPAAETLFDNKNREIRKGEHIVCALDNTLENKKEHFACFLKVPLNHIEKDSKEPEVKWELN